MSQQPPADDPFLRPADGPPPEKDSLASKTGNEESGAAHANPKGVPANKPYPEKIGKYRVLRPLGKGGFGQVYLAFDDDLKRHVARCHCRRSDECRTQGVQHVVSGGAKARKSDGSTVPGGDPQAANLCGG